MTKIPWKVDPNLNQSLIDKFGADVERFLLYTNPPDRLIINS